MTQGIVVSSPAVAEGNVYVGSYDNCVYAFGPASMPMSFNSEWPEIVVAALVLAIVAVVGPLLVARWYRLKRKSAAV
jgi:outer membrane protein assembly factor BamB